MEMQRDSDFTESIKAVNFITGDTVNITNGSGVLLKCLLPKAANIKLVHNGKVINQISSMEAAWKVSAREFTEPNAG